MNPPITTRVQNSLTYLLPVAMYARPCIVEDSRKAVNPSMAGAWLQMLTVAVCIAVSWTQAQVHTCGSQWCVACLVKHRKMQNVKFNLDITVYWLFKRQALLYWIRVIQRVIQIEYKIQDWIQNTKLYVSFNSCKKLTTSKNTSYWKIMNYMILCSFK